MGFASTFLALHDVPISRFSSLWSSSTHSCPSPPTQGPSDHSAEHCTEQEGLKGNKEVTQLMHNVE